MVFFESFLANALLLFTGEKADYCAVSGNCAQIIQTLDYQNRKGILISYNIDSSHLHGEIVHDNYKCVQDVLSNQVILRINQSFRQISILTASKSDDCFGGNAGSVMDFSEGLKCASKFANPISKSVNPLSKFANP